MRCRRGDTTTYQATKSRTAAMSFVGLQAVMAADGEVPPPGVLLRWRPSGVVGQGFGLLPGSGTLDSETWLGLGSR